MPLVECEICNEEYSNVKDPQIPRVLQCGHSICLNCASQLIRNCSLVCPFCRGVTNVRTANDLQKNFSLVQAIELLKDKSAEISSSPPSLLQSEASKLGEQLSSRSTQLDEHIAEIQTTIEALNTAQLTNMEGGDVLRRKLDQISLHYSTLREYLNKQENREIQNLKKLARDNFSKNEKMLIESEKRFAQMNVLSGMCTIDLLANSSVLEGLGSSWDTSGEEHRFFENLKKFLFQKSPHFSGTRPQTLKATQTGHLHFHPTHKSH